MGLPVKLSDDLVADARREAELNDRSLTGQVEHWAKLGRIAERVLPYADVIQIKSTGSLSEQAKQALTKALSSLLNEQDQSQFASKVLAAPHPVYSEDPEDPSLIIQVLPTGERIRGRMVARKFVPLTAKEKAA